MSKRKVEHGRVNDEESILKTAWPDYLLGLVTLSSLGLAVASLFPATGLQSNGLWIDALFSANETTAHSSNTTLP